MFSSGRAAAKHHKPFPPYAYEHFAHFCEIHPLELDWMMGIGDKRLEIGDKRLEIRDWRLETRDWRLEIVDQGVGIREQSTNKAVNSFNNQAGNWPTSQPVA